MRQAGALIVLISVALLAGGLARPQAVAREAAVVEAVCHALLANTTAGRQALVSSVWWPPLPALYRLPFAAALPRIEGWPVPSLAVSAVAGAATLFLLQRMLARWGFGAAGLLVVVAVAANPYFLAECFNGANGTSALFLALLAAYGLAEWESTRRLRALVYFAFGAALLLATSAEMAPWLAVAALLLVAGQAAERGAPPGRRQAVLLLGLLPPAAMAGLWVLMNWLIMGDGLYFVRPLLRLDRLAAVPVPQAAITPLHAGAFAVALAATLFAAARRDRGGLALGLLALVPGLVALAARHAGLLWSRVPLLFVLPVLALAAAAHAARRSARRAAAGRTAVVLLAVTAAAWSYPEAAVRDAAADRRYGAALAQRNEWLPQIESRVLAHSPFSKVFVCGYDSFLLLGAEARWPFLHALDFNFHAAQDDWAGCPLFLLVHRPEGRSAMESVHGRYDRVYELGSRNTLYNSDWGPWRLYEIVQAPRAPAPPVP